MIHRFILFFVLVFFVSQLILANNLDDDPEVLIPIYVYDNGTVPEDIILEFGIDQTGTDSLDVLLGEIELPPPPPSGVFFTRFLLPPGSFSEIASYRDIRISSGYPYSGSHEYRIKYQVSQGATFIVIKWDLPEGVSGDLQDLFGGVIININMNNQDSLVVSNFAIDQLKMIINYDQVLSVELSSFSVRVSNRNVLLGWKTESELNNRGFEIERKTNFSDWEMIGFIQGNGTTSSPNYYSYLDASQLMFSTYFYRLKQIDYNGDFEYSKIIQVDFYNLNSYELEQNYPNPFNPSTNISFSIPHRSYVTIIIYDVIGQNVAELVNEFLERGTYNYMWNAVGFNSGIYFYELRTDDFTSIKKMQLIK
jgi:hypothetical protein